MGWRMFFGSAGCVVAVMVMLWLTNAPRRYRYRQRWCPLAALSFSALAVWIYIHPYRFIDNLIMNVIFRLNSIPGVQIPIVPHRFSFLYNFSLLFLFFGVKSGWRIITGMVSFFRQIWRWLVRKPDRARYVQPEARGMFPAYKRNFDDNAFLLDSWVYPRQYFLVLAFSLLFMFLYSLFDDYAPISFHLPIVLPMLPAVPLLLTFEIAWYLGGLREGEEQPETAGTDVCVTRQGNFELLWKKYHSFWPERLLVAEPVLNNASDGMSRSLSHRSSGVVIERVEVECQIVEECLGRQRITLNASQKNILRDLWQGEDLSIVELLYQQVAPVLFASLQRRLLDGDNILFVIPERLRRSVSGRKTITDWVRRWLDFPAYAAVCWHNIEVGVNPDNSIGIVSVNEALQEVFPEERAELWIKQLSMVVFVDAIEVLARDMGACQAFYFSLADMRGKSPQFVLLAREDRANLDSAMRNFFGVKQREYALPHSFPARSYLLAWGNEGPAPYQEKLVHYSQYLGCEPVFAIPALQDGVGEILLTGMEQTIWREAFEELDKNLVSVEAKRLVDSPACPSLFDPLKMPIVITNDYSCNLPSAIKNSLALGEKEVLALVGTPTYLFRDYFADNILFFLSESWVSRTRLAVSPLFDRYGVACCLVSRLLVTWVRDDSIQTLLNGAGYDFPALKGVNAIIEDCFQINLLREGLLNKDIRWHFDQEGNRYEQVLFIRLNANAAFRFKNVMADCWRIVDQSDNVMDVVAGEHAYQLFLPNQIHVFEGRPYEIRKINPMRQEIIVNKSEKNNFCHYHPDLTLIMQTSPSRPINQRTSEYGIWLFTVAVCEAGFRVKTSGYFTLFLNGSVYAYESLEDVNGIPDREYGLGRILRFSAKRRDNTGSVLSSVTLATLLQQAFKTVFPEKWQFLLVTCKDTAAADSTGDNHDMRLAKPVDLLPKLEIPECDADQDGACGLDLIFLEDSHRDLGLIRALYDNWQIIFDLLADYLCWLIQKVETSDEDGIKLVYGTGIKFSLTELKACLQVLNDLTADLPQRLQKQRREFQGMAVTGGAASQERVCDFCGEIMSGSSFESLNDGRERCPNCRDTAVNTVKGLDKVYREARKWLVKKFYPLKIRKNVQVKFASAEEIANELKRPFSATAGFDARTVGFARRRDNDCSIYIENGQPYHMTLATMVHELTHIWQEDNLDMEELEAQHGLLYIEGHATWAEITCLRERGLGVEFCDRELLRQDVYGQGARAIAEIAAANDNPFVYLAQYFPK